MRKLLNSLYITEEDIYLTLDGENIVCKSENKEKLRLPFSNIEGIYCFSFLGCSPALMGKCAEYGIPINFISPYGRYLASVKGKIKGNILLRKAQYDKFSAPEQRLYQNLVAVKLANTRGLIKQFIKDHSELDSDGKLTNCINSINEHIEKVYCTENEDTIRGIEGTGAKKYFDIFDDLILSQKDDFTFTMRTKRPPLDRVNAVLSFMYTIWTCDYESALDSVGLDSCMGFYHKARPGRASLACDLVEETRYIIDKFVLMLINLRILKPKDFDVQVSGAVMLNKDGKKKVITKWQEKKRTDIMHPYLKEKIKIGLIPYVQSMLLAKYIRGEIEEYPCWLNK